MLAARIEEQAHVDDSHAQLIRDTLLEGMSSPTSQAINVQKAWEEAQRERRQPASEGAGAL